MRRQQQNQQPPYAMCMHVSTYARIYTCAYWYGTCGDLKIHGSATRNFMHIRDTHRYTRCFKPIIINNRIRRTWNHARAEIRHGDLIFSSLFRSLALFKFTLTRVREIYHLDLSTIPERWRYVFRVVMDYNSGWTYGYRDHINFRLMLIERIPYYNILNILFWFHGVILYICMYVCIYLSINDLYRLCVILFHIEINYIKIFLNRRVNQEL